MNGRLVAGLLLAVALVAGAALWWVLEYAYYEELSPDDPRAVIRILPRDGGAPRPLAVAWLRAIDAASAPIRFRACFRLAEPVSGVIAEAAPAPEPKPLNGPAWFDCYDARRIGEALARGEAVALLSEPDIHPGVDRIIAVFPDGSGYAWHQLNEELAE